MYGSHSQPFTIMVCFGRRGFGSILTLVGKPAAAHSDDPGFSDGEAYLLRGALIEELSGVSEEVLRFRPGSFWWDVGVWFDDDGRASSQDGV